MEKFFGNKYFIVHFCLSLLIGVLCLGCIDENAPIIADDGSIWERVNKPGFGNENNIAVVAMAEYKEYLYAMTRNEEKGAEVWRKSKTTDWEQVLFPDGEKNGIYGNPHINNIWGNMIEFKDRLYFGFSSGFQGNVLGSTGCEIWRYDGSTWEAVISDKKDTEGAEATGTITAISGCDDNDGDTTAVITDDSKNWDTSPPQWSGGVLTITTGDGIYRKFKIVSNTSNTLTIQQNERAGTGANQAEEIEYTVCGSKTYNNPYPKYSYSLGAVQTGDSYEIGMGNDENGFGDFWNKTTNEMRIFDNKLYVTTCLNYEYGAQVWYTEDGDNWTVTQPSNSFGNYHTDSSYPNSQKAVSTSITSLCISSVSGDEVLYAGGTGSAGNLGSCARVAKLTDTGWELIVDASVDENDAGTNENGFGDGMNCDMDTGNFMPWSLASFNGLLHAGTFSMAGARVLYSTNGGAEDGSWFYSMGGDSALPAGFDGVTNGAMTDTYQNICVNLFPFGDYLFAGTISLFVPEYGADEQYLTGSQIWKSSDGKSWSRVTGNGFNDKQIVNFEAFAVFDGQLYVSGSKGVIASPQGLGGAKIFRLAE
jgi:hypothetical protein